jgi:hypothetical protein
MRGSCPEGELADAHRPEKTLERMRGTSVYK